MCKNKISTIIFKNAIVFLNDSIYHFNCGIEKYDYKILTVVEIQMALELAIKYRLVTDHDIRIIFEKVDNNYSEERIIDDFERNKLKVKEFDRLKNFLKSDPYYNEIFSHEFIYMEKFQLYRNKLVHSNYNFSEKENTELSDDIIHIIVYILHHLLSSPIDDEEYREFFYDYMVKEEYEKLLSNPQFYSSLQDMIDYEYGDPYYCPICDRKLLTPHKKCLGCLNNFSDTQIYGYIKCARCKEEMVIYDNCNIDINTTLRGMCLYCLQDTVVYKCPKCGSVTNLEALNPNDCRFDYCFYDQTNTK